MTVDEMTCPGGCGRATEDCCHSEGVDYCADLVDYQDHGEPETWEEFERLHFGDDDDSVGPDASEFGRAGHKLTPQHERGE